MILFCDEDVGTGIPKALSLVGYTSHSMFGLGWRTHKDYEWLPRVGEAQWLAFSYNKKMLLVPSERDLIVQNKVGIVFLTSGEVNPAKVLQLLLGKWDTLELLHETTDRPFARFLAPYGRLTDKYKKFYL